MDQQGKSLDDKVERLVLYLLKKFAQVANLFNVYNLKKVAFGARLETRMVLCIPVLTCQQC